MNILECKGLTKNFGSLKAINDINLNIQPGKIVGLLGPNGSGKTTLLKMANGLLSPNKGEILINGNKPGVESKKIVSYLPDRISLQEWMSPDELRYFYSDFFEDFDTAKAAKYMEDLGIDTKKPIKYLSKGTREKVQLVLTMTRNAKLYLLDEPIGGVDPATRDYILRTIVGNYRDDATIIISTHLIADIEKILDEVVFLDKGEIRLHSTVDEIREKNGKSVDVTFREVFKC